MLTGRQVNTRADRIPVDWPTAVGSLAMQQGLEVLFHDPIVKQYATRALGEGAQSSGVFT
jgi:hypothetical protein